MIPYRGRDVASWPVEPAAPFPGAPAVHDRRDKSKLRLRRARAAARRARLLPTFLTFAHAGGPATVAGASIQFSVMQHDSIASDHDTPFLLADGGRSTSVDVPRVRATRESAAAIACVERAANGRWNAARLAPDVERFTLLVLHGSDNAGITRQTTHGLHREGGTVLERSFLGWFTRKSSGRPTRFKSQSGIGSPRGIA